MKKPIKAEIDFNLLHYLEHAKYGVRHNKIVLIPNEIRAKAN